MRGNIRAGDRFWQKHHQKNYHMPLTVVQANSVPRLVEFTLDGAVSERQMQELYHRVEAIYQEGKPVRVICELQNFGGFDGISGFVASIREQVKMLPMIERFAVVVGPEWLAKLGSVVDNAITPTTEVKYFGNNDKDSALDWLSGGARPAMS